MRTLPHANIVGKSVRVIINHGGFLLVKSHYHVPYVIAIGSNTKIVFSELITAITRRYRNMKILHIRMSDAVAISILVKVSVVIFIVEIKI